MTINDLKKLIAESIEEVLDETGCEMCGENISDELQKDIDDLKKLIVVAQKSKENPEENAEFIKFAVDSYGSMDGYIKMLRSKLSKMESRNKNKYPQSLEYPERIRSDEPPPFGYGDESYGSIDESQLKRLKNLIRNTIRKA